MPSFEERYEAMRRETIEHRKVYNNFYQNMINDVTKEMVELSLPKLYEFITQSTSCCGCGNTKNVQIYYKGLCRSYLLHEASLILRMYRCEQKLIEDERRDVANMIASMHMPKDVLKATLKDLAIDNHSRLSIADQAAEFVAYYKRTGELPSKGLLFIRPIWCREIICAWCNC